MTRFCKFCNKEFNTEDESHWTSNGSKLPRCKLQRADYNKRNRKLRRIYNQHYYSKNRDNILKKCRQHYEVNSEHISTRKRALRESDPLRKIKDSYFTSVKRAFTVGGFKKNSKTFKLLGCDFNELKDHFESKFTPDMSWGNYGIIWEIDHICPGHQAKTYDEVVKLCNYINLRPMHVSKNRRKSKRGTLEAKIMCSLLLKRQWI